MPNRASLAVKWHEEKTVPWHWLVYMRDNAESFVPDSKKTLRTHRRTGSVRIKPKWFLELEE